MSSLTNAIEAGRAFLKVVVDDADVAKGFERVQAKLNTLGQKMQKWGAITTAVSGAVVASFGAAVKAFSTFGDQMDKMRSRTGFTARTLSALAHAADTSGTSIQAVEKAIRGMQRGFLSAEMGSSAMVETLGQLGISLDEIQKLSPEDQFMTLSQAIADVDDPSRRAALSMRVFGKSGVDLLPMLAEGAAGIRAMMKEAEELGFTLSEKDATAAAELNDALGRVQRQLQFVMVHIGAAVSGPVTEFADKLRDVLKSVIGFIKENPNLITAIGKAGGAASLAGASATAFGAALTFTSAHPVIAGLSLLVGSLQLVNEWLEKNYHQAEQLGKKLGEVGPPRPLTEDEKKGGPYMVDRQGNLMLDMPVADFYGDKRVAEEKEKAALAGISVPHVATPSIDPMQAINAQLGITRHKMGAGNGLQEVKKRLGDWTDAALNVGNVLNPLAGVDVGGIAGKASRLGKKALAGDIDFEGALNDGLQGAADAFKGLQDWLFDDKSQLVSAGTFSAAAAGSLGGVDNQILDVNKQQLAVLNRIEKKDGGWGAT
jgi:hypothetical protein